jgi:hypothetical protein
MKAPVLCLALLLLCSACGKREPAGPTAEQTAQLNEMENALNAEAANEEGPANRSAGPSNASE